tara:strand:+ start:7877 stop:8011 length:135 start_codon:yes stop_codon:yes gene_type:complete
MPVTDRESKGAWRKKVAEAIKARGKSKTAPKKSPASKKKEKKDG